MFEDTEIDGLGTNRSPTPRRANEQNQQDAGSANDTGLPQQPPGGVREEVPVGPQHPPGTSGIADLQRPLTPARIASLQSQDTPARTSSQQSPSTPARTPSQQSPVTPARTPSEPPTQQRISSQPPGALPPTPGHQTPQMRQRRPQIQGAPKKQQERGQRQPIIRQQPENIARSRTRGPDKQLDTEFLYYANLIKVEAMALSREDDKRRVLPWITKLFGPEYAAPPFQEKRNRYLCSLSLSLMNDELAGVFASPPPAGALPNWDDIELGTTPMAGWQQDTMWDETLSGIGGGAPEVDRCNFHDEKNPCPVVNTFTNEMMDTEFAYCLHLCRPYAAMMPSADEKTKVATWLQALQMISRNACPLMKGMRNDYIQALLGCIFDLRTAGPFIDYPPMGPLTPLIEAARDAAKTQRPITDPGSKAANDFLRTQPFPDEGAFCYIAVTGDVHDTNLAGLIQKGMKVHTPPRTSLHLSVNQLYDGVSAARSTHKTPTPSSRPLTPADEVSAASRHTYRAPTPSAPPLPPGYDVSDSRRTYRVPTPSAPPLRPGDDVSDSRRTYRVPTPSAPPLRPGDEASAGPSTRTTPISSASPLSPNSPEDFVIRRPPPSAVMPEDMQRRIQKRKSTMPYEILPPVYYKGG